MTPIQTLHVHLLTRSMGVKLPDALAPTPRSIRITPEKDLFLLAAISKQTPPTDMGGAAPVGRV